MIPILVKSDGVRSGTKAKAKYGLICLNRLFCINVTLNGVLNY